MRSAFDSCARSTIARPIARLRTVVRLTLTPSSAPERGRLGERSSARASAADISASSVQIEGNADDVESLDGGPMLGGELHRRCGHLLADDAELHRHEHRA